MPVLTLIRTAPSSPPGSMLAYAELVRHALTDTCPEGLDVRYCDFFDPHGGGSMRRHHLWRLVHGRSFFSKHRSDWYHLLDGSMAGFLPSRIWDRTLVTVHDLIPLLQLQGELPGEPGRIGKHLIERGQRMLSAAAGVTAVSASTQKDLVGSTGRTDVVVVAHPVRSLPDPDTAHDLPPRYLFHVGNNAEYKNRLGVLDVFAKLQDIPDLHLLMAGEPPTGALLRRAAELERVRFLTHVTDAQLAALYQSAAILIFPSLYEGFGMPVLEAMAAGCPVVCSSAASLPEVAGGAAMLAAAGDVETTANHCRILLEDSALYDSLVVRGLQWSQQFTMARFARELREWFSTICF